jgi:hypothetical protein
MSDGQLAHMASVVGIRPERLEAIGKTEAAAILRTIEDMQPAPAEPKPAQSLHELAEQMRALRLEVEWLREQDRKRDEEIEQLRKRESS